MFADRKGGSKSGRGVGSPPLLTSESAQKTFLLQVKGLRGTEQDPEEERSVAVYMPLCDGLTLIPF